jgi:hypothetical protein
MKIKQKNDVEMSAPSVEKSVTPKEKAQAELAQDKSWIEKHRHMPMDKHDKEFFHRALEFTEKAGKEMGLYEKTKSQSDLNKAQASLRTAGDFIAKIKKAA